MKRKVREIPAELNLIDEKTETKDNLDELLEMLSETERLLLILRDGYGYTFVQMAKATGLTYKQVRGRYQKAFKILKNFLKKGKTKTSNPLYK